MKSASIRGGLRGKMAIAWLWAFAGLMGWADAAVIEERFDTDPETRGWRTRGDASLFWWDHARGALGVTWDSSRENSFFALPLGMHLGRRDDFEFGFDLQLVEYRAGANPAKPGTFQISAGLLKLGEAIRPEFVRASGTASPNLVEWVWFGADASISASLSPVVTSTNLPPRWAFRDSFVALDVGPIYRFVLSYAARDSTLRLSMTVDGLAGPMLDPVVLPPSFTDFQVDTFSVTSYSDAGQDPRYAGSVFARGLIDNLRLVLPEPPIRDLRYVGSGVLREVQFTGIGGWHYYLEASGGGEFWSTIEGPEPGIDGTIVMHDNRKALFPFQFYRVRAERD